MTKLYSTSKERDIVHSGVPPPHPPDPNPRAVHIEVVWEGNQSVNGFKIDWPREGKRRLHTKCRNVGVFRP